ncbi:MAG: hypothetical protein KAR40_09535 [Candidatus Sabulitectum sp.]|nr:hypothetical protein [Candidatus Sabulitectum sp.]
MKVYSVIFGFFLAILMFGCFGLYLSVSGWTNPDQTELQAELDRLIFYKNLIDNNEIQLTYNGCEDMRERLGL